MSDKQVFGMSGRPVPGGEPDGANSGPPKPGLTLDSLAALAPEDLRRLIKVLDPLTLFRALSGATLAVEVAVREAMTEEQLQQWRAWRKQTGGKDDGDGGDRTEVLLTLTGLVRLGSITAPAVRPRHHRDS